MRAIDLAYYLENHEELDFAEFNDLEAVAKQYPFCLGLKLLLLKKAQMQNLPNYEKLLNVAATYTPDRKYLYKFVKAVPAREMATVIADTADSEAFDLTEVLEIANLDYDDIEEIQPPISGFEIFPDSQLEGNDTFEFIAEKQSSTEEELVDLYRDDLPVFDLSFENAPLVENEETNANSQPEIETPSSELEAIETPSIEAPLTSDPNDIEMLSEDFDLSESPVEAIIDDAESLVEQSTEAPESLIVETVISPDPSKDLNQEPSLELETETAAKQVEELNEPEDLGEEIIEPEVIENIVEETPLDLEKIEPNLDLIEEPQSLIEQEGERIIDVSLEPLEPQDTINPTEDLVSEENLSSDAEEPKEEEVEIPVDEFNDFLNNLGLSTPDPEEEEAPLNLELTAKTTAPLASIDLPEIIIDQEEVIIESVEVPNEEVIVEEENKLEEVAQIDLPQEESISLKPSEEEPQLEDFIAEELAKEVPESIVLEANEAINTATPTFEAPDFPPKQEDLQLMEDKEEIAQDIEAYEELIEEVTEEESPEFVMKELDFANEPLIHEEKETAIEEESKAFLIPSLQEEENMPPQNEISFADWLKGLRPSEEEQVKPPAEQLEPPEEEVESSEEVVESFKEEVTPAEVQTITEVSAPIAAIKETPIPAPKGELEIPETIQEVIQVPSTEELDELQATEPPEPTVEFPKLKLYKLPGSENPLPWDADEFKEPVKKEKAKKKAKKKTKKKKGKKSIRLLAKASVQDNEEIISEPLAALLAMQGKTKKAIKMYQQLILKFPEKSTYFAGKLDKLIK